MKIKISYELPSKSWMFFIVVALVFASVQPSRADLRAPLQGAALKSGLTPDQHRRAMYFKALKTTMLQSSSSDAIAAIQRVELATKIVHTILDICSFAGDVKDTGQAISFMSEKTNRIAQASNIIVNGISSHKLKTYLIQRKGADRTARIFLLTGTFLQMINQEIPILMEDSLFQQYAQALESDDIEDIATKFAALLDHPNPWVNWIVNTVVSNAIDIVSDLPEYLTVGKDLVPLVKSIGFWNGIKAVSLIKQAVPVQAIITGAIGISIDLAAASVVSGISAQTKSIMIALEFLDYYLVTYGGNLGKFKEDIGADASTTIAEVFDHFMDQQIGVGQTMKEFYGAVDWLDVIFDDKADKTIAVALIRKIMRETGALAFKINYQGGPDGFSYIGVGDTTTYSFEADPLLRMDYTFNAAAIVEHLPNGNTVNHTIVNSGSITPVSLVPGNHSFDIDYRVFLIGNSTPLDYYFRFNDDIYVPADSLTPPELTITPSIVNNMGYKLSFNFALPANLVTYNRPASATNAAVSGTLDKVGTTGLVRIVDLNGSIENVSEWMDISSGSATIIMPLVDIDALLAKYGDIGAYFIQLEMNHPYVYGFKSHPYTKIIKYSDLVGDTSVPYLAIQATPSVRALSLYPDMLQFVEGDVLKLYPRNVPGWPNFNALVGTVKVALLDNNYNDYLLSGTLLSDGGVQVIIPPDLPCLPDVYYKILAVFSLDGETKHNPGPFSTYQLLELDATLGTNPPPSTTGTITLPRTGQYRCYDPAGAEIPCAGTGQDGDIQAGKPRSQTPRFTDNGDQTMTDTVTGLIWSKNANVPGPGICGPGTVKTWQGALDYVDCLNNNNYLNHGDWRLPNQKELSSIVDRQQVNPATWLISQGFSNVKPGNYWSSGSSVSYASDGWFVSMNIGYVDIESKNNVYNVWPVRGGDAGGEVQLPRTGQTVCYNSAGSQTDCQTLGQTQDAAMLKGVAWSSASRFVQHGNGTVTDNLTGLIWLQNANCTATVGGISKTGGTLPWANALTWSKGLASGSCGLNDGSAAGDWRLPNPAELDSLVDLQRTFPALPVGHPFSNVQTNFYWSSSSVASPTFSAWYVGMHYGGVNHSNKGDSYSVWPVRGGHIDPVKVLPPNVTLISENLPDGSYQVGPATKAWRFKSGASPIINLKAMLVSLDSGLGISHTEIDIGNIAANTEFLVYLPINPVHDTTALKSSYWKLVDDTGAVAITNSITGQFWMKIKTNRPPTFSPLQLDSISGQVGALTSLPILASDPDGDILTYSVVSGAGNIVNGLWQGKPAMLYQHTFASSGIYPVTLQLNDGHGETITRIVYAVIAPEWQTANFFTDVSYPGISSGAAYDKYAAIHYLTLNGITIGRPDPYAPAARIFEPNKIANQAEALGMIMKAASVRGVLDLDTEARWLPNLIKEDTENGIYYNFSWALPYVLKAEAVGMIPSADTFEPNKGVTREWLASMVTSMMALTTPMDAVSPGDYIFADQGDFTTPYYYDTARAVAYFGYMTGQLGNSVAFKPLDMMIRADVAVVTAKILRTPSIDGLVMNTPNQPESILVRAEYPSSWFWVYHGQNFTISGGQNLFARRMLGDGNGNIQEDPIFTAAEYTKATIIRPGYGIVASRLFKDLASTPITVPTNQPDISSSEARSFIVMLESVDDGSSNPVRRIYRINYDVIFPDRDRDGVRDELDLWPDNPLFSTDANFNGIPDNADMLWGLTDRQGNEVVKINGRLMQITYAVLDNLYSIIANDNTSPVITQFELPQLQNRLYQPGSILISAYDNVDILGYCYTETDNPSSCIWNYTAFDVHMFSSEGPRTLYAFVKDSAGHTARATASVLIDATPPIVSGFTISVQNDLTLAGISIVATDESSGVAGYCLTEEDNYSNCVWTASAPTSYNFTTYGNKTLYTFVKDVAGNYSGSHSTLINIVGPQTLNITVSGTGGGTVTSSPSGINCPDSACSSIFPGGTQVTLTPTPNAFSTFSGWIAYGGWASTCNGTGSCVISLINSGTVTASFTSTVPAFSWSGTFHVTKSDSSQVDQLEVGILTSATSLAGMSVIVSGPNGFNYSFNDADKVPWTSGTLVLSHDFASLQPGVYTFTLNDGQGHTFVRTDTHAPNSLITPVDVNTIQLQRKADGSYRFSWGPSNDGQSNYYRVRIETLSGIPVYIGTRKMNTYEDVASGRLTNGTAYRVGVETGDAPSVDLTFNRSYSSYKNFTPSSADYNSNRLLFSWANVHNLVDGSGNVTMMATFSVDKPETITLAELTGPNGFSYTFNNGADYASARKEYSHSFAGQQQPGVYTFHIVADGIDQFFYSDLAAATVYPLLDSTTMQASDLGGTVRFSWADVPYNGALYYRVYVLDTVSGAVISSTRLNQAYADFSTSSLGTLATKQWRVEVVNSANINTQRNRRNSEYIPLVVQSDMARPILQSSRVFNSFDPSGNNTTGFVVSANDATGTITSLLVTGPNNFSSDLLTDGRQINTSTYLLYQDGSAPSGLYTVIANDNNGKNDRRYTYQPEPHAISSVDYKSFHVDQEANGNLRFSWAPVASDVPLWYWVDVYTVADHDGSGFPDSVSLPNQTSYLTTTSLVVSPALLPNEQLMFRVLAYDASHVTTANNRSTSTMVAYHGYGYNYASLVDGDGDGFTSDIDSDDNNAFANPIAATHSLTVEVTGNGAGTVTSNPSGISCTTGNCMASIYHDTPVTLHQTPDVIYSTFAGWNGACAGTGACNVTMNTAKTVTATFNLVPKIKLDVLETTGFDTLAEAYSNTNGYIHALGITFNGNWTLSGGKNVILKGGYLSDYGQTRSGATTLRGKLTVQNGSLRVDGIKVRQ